MTITATEVRQTFALTGHNAFDPVTESVGMS